MQVGEAVQMMVIFSAMPEPLRMPLKYDGSNVDDGTMPVEDVREALQGFSGAYGNVASRVDPEGQHQLRVAAVRTGSFDLLILAWIATTQMSEGLVSSRSAPPLSRRAKLSLESIPPASQTHSDRAKHF